ncbi:MAG: hypothetical protein ACTSPD_15250 [Promethearchaeota archaeon]
MFKRSEKTLSYVADLPSGRSLVVPKFEKKYSKNCTFTYIYFIICKVVIRTRKYGKV